jgi:hypothetical protein
MRKLLLLLILLFAVRSANGQTNSSESNPLGGNVVSADAGTCSTYGTFLWQKLPINASSTTVNLSGTFSGTVTVRLSNNGGFTWTTAGTQTGIGTASYATTGFSDLCADVTTYASGNVGISILTGLLQVQSVVSGSSSGSGITQVPTETNPCTGSTIQSTTTAPFGIVQCVNGSPMAFAPGSGIVYAASYGAQGLMQVESNGANFTVTSGSNIVTSTTLHFLTSTYHVCAVGDILWATNWPGSDLNYTSSVAVIGLGSATAVTVTSCDSDTQVHISANASGNAGTTNTNQGWLAYGPDDQTANHAAKVAAYDNTITGCKTLQLAGPFTNMDLPDFNTAACEGVSGGATTSKYVGLIGQNPSGNTTILVPPWYGLGNLSTLCNGALSGIACNGGAGGMFNVTWNGGGQSSLALGGHSFLESANDTSWSDVYAWGIAANSTNSIGFTLNAGIHIGINIIIDGTGQIPCQNNGLVSTIFSLECYNGTPTTAGGLNVKANMVCYTCVVSAPATSGIAVDVQNGATYWGFGDFIAGLPFVGGCYVAGTGTTIHLNGVNCKNNGGATNATFLKALGTGIATVTNSQIGGGSVSGVWNCPATAQCIDQGGNGYQNVPLQGGAGSLIQFTTITNCAVITASPAACGVAAAGTVAVPTAATTYTVNTQAVTANSQIIIQQDTSTTAGTRLGVTCNTTVSTALPLLTAKVAGTSFTFSLTAPAVNPACFSYQVIN